MNPPFKEPNHRAVRWKYILNAQGKPVAETDLLKWATWFESIENRVVGRDQIGDSQISTVFLGIDHGFSSNGHPVLWETMVFGGPLDETQDRCSGNREQAESMHARMVRRVTTEFHRIRAGLGPSES